MVESTPDPADGHCGIEVWLSKKSGWNHLWGRRFRQIRTFTQNPVSPDKHLSFIWCTQRKYALFQITKSMTKKILRRDAPVWLYCELQQTVEEHGLIKAELRE